MKKKIGDFPEEAQALIEKLLESHPYIDAAVLIVDYDPALAEANLPGFFMKAQTEEFSEVQRFHSMCLHGASAVNGKVMKDLAEMVELYRTTQEKAENEGEEDNDS